MVNKTSLVQNFQKVYGKMMMNHEISTKGTANAMQEIVMKIGEDYAGQEFVDGNDIRKLIKVICGKQAMQKVITSHDAEVMIKAFEGVIRNREKYQEEANTSSSKEINTKKGLNRMQQPDNTTANEADDTAEIDDVLNSLGDQTEDPVELAREEQAKEEKQRDDNAAKAFADVVTAPDDMFTDPIDTKAKKTESSGETKSYPVVEAVSQPYDYKENDKRPEEPDADDIDQWMTTLGMEKEEPQSTSIKVEEAPIQKAPAPKIETPDAKDQPKPKQERTTSSSMPVKKTSPADVKEDQPMNNADEYEDEDGDSIEDILAAYKEGIQAAQKMQERGKELIRKGTEMQEDGRKNELYFRDMIANMKNIEDTMKAAVELGKELDKNRPTGSRRIWSATMYQDNTDDMKITLKGTIK